MTNRDKVLEFMRSIVPSGATNEEIVAKTGVRPHTQVFQITRKLKNEGLLKAVQAGKEWRFWYAGKKALSAKPMGDLEGVPAVTFRDPESIVVEDQAGKPPLTCDTLLGGGFTLIAHWRLSADGRPQLDAFLPKDIGVYAFASAGRVLYVGVATMGLKRRLYLYGKPGPTQRTNQRIQELIREALSAGKEIEVYIALPTDSSWNGLPIHGSAGLELGLIRKYSLAWNKRSAG
jgi:hypothetical protein